MKKTVVLVLVALFGTIIFGGCGVKQNNIQVNNVTHQEQTIANKNNEISNNQLQKSIINPYHPIAFMGGAYDGELSKATVLGGYQNNKWYTIDDFDYFIKEKKVPLQSFLDNQSLQESSVDTNLLKGNETFKFYSNSQLLSTVNAKGSKPTMFVSPASAQASLNFNIENVNTKEKFIIGVNGDWNALPRIPKVLSDNSYLIDLDNDNAPEKVTANFIETSKDYYKVVVEMEKNNKKIKVSEGNMTKESLKYFKIMILDLNGDGKMEIITYTTGTAGGISIVEINGNEVKNVLGYDSGE